MIFQVTSYNEPKDDIPLSEVLEQFFALCESQSHIAETESN